MITFHPISALNQTFEEEYHASLKNFLQDGKFILGNGVVQFEKEWANYCGTKFCCGTSNGHDALMLLLKAFDWENDAEIIVPSNTYIATILSVINAGYKPVLAEPAANSYLMDFENVKQKINSKTKAVVVVHLYGEICYDEDFHSFLNEKNILLFEDAAQSHGATYKNKKAGNLGDAAAFSFYPTKNLGALGDAGAITTNNEAIYLCVNSLRNYGKNNKSEFDFAGFNCRLDDLQARFLSVKLPQLNTQNNKRKIIAEKYLNKITNPLVQLPQRNATSVWHLFVVRVKDREKFMNYMSNNAIETLIHYPVSPSKEKALLEHVNGFYPNAEALAHEVVSLPLHPLLSDEEIEKIIFTVNRYA